MDKKIVGSSKTKKEALATYSTGRPRFNRPGLKLPAVASRPRIGRLALTLLLMAFVLGLSGGWLGSYAYDRHIANNHTSTSQKQQYVSDESQLIASIAKDVGQSVVSVDTAGQTTSQDFFGFTQQNATQSSGTGFIVSPDGIIVTNRHVVPEGTTGVSVTLSDGTKYDGVKVIGRTANSSPLDVAFLKISDTKSKRLVPVILGDSTKMQVGDRVIAIGNALGQFQNTVTTGIISGYGRDVQAGDQAGTSSENLTDLFQTDAAINEGNSGGPLVNISGEVIGLNTAVASGAQNIGFSIPISDVKGLINSVLGSGQLQQPYLGVRYISLTADVAHRYNLKINQGAYVAPSEAGTLAVLPDSPAQQAGIKEKDVITKVNGTNVDDKNNLTAILSRFKVGDQVNLTVVRGDKTLHLKARLQALPNS